MSLLLVWTTEMAREKVFAGCTCIKVLAKGSSSKDPPILKSDDRQQKEEREQTPERVQCTLVALREPLLISKR